MEGHEQDIFHNKLVKIDKKHGVEQQQQHPNSIFIMYIYNHKFTELIS